MTWPLAAVIIVGIVAVTVAVVSPLWVVSHAEQRADDKPAPDMSNMVRWPPQIPAMPPIPPPSPPPPVPLPPRGAPMQPMLPTETPTPDPKPEPPDGDEDGDETAAWPQLRT